VPYGFGLMIVLLVPARECACVCWQSVTAFPYMHISDIDRARFLAFRVCVCCVLLCPRLQIRCCVWDLPPCSLTCIDGVFCVCDSPRRLAGHGASVLFLAMLYDRKGVSALQIKEVRVFAWGWGVGGDRKGAPRLRVGNRARAPYRVAWHAFVVCRCLRMRLCV
jgi:hypothetical protein